MADLRLTAHAQGQAYEQLRDTLILVESSNRPGAAQDNSSAKGLFQFTAFWQKFTEQQTGRTLQSFLPKDNSPAELERSGREQREILFPKYYEKQIAPFVATIRREHLAEGQSDIDIAAAFHNAGEPAAYKYFKTGEDSVIGTKGNKGIRSYQAAVRRNLGKDVGTFQPEPDRRFASKRASTHHAASAEDKAARGPNATKPVLTASYSRKAATGAMLTSGPDAILETNRDILKKLQQLALELTDGRV